MAHFIKWNKKKFHKWVIQSFSHSALSSHKYDDYDDRPEYFFYNLLYIILFWEIASNHQILCTDFHKKKDK